MQNEELSEHVPFLQSPEQQAPAPVAPAVQALPAVRQVVLSGTHLLPVQLPLQQDAESVQAALSDVQLVAVLQSPRVVSHWRLQQSVFAVQDIPTPRQVVTREAQVPMDVSQDCEQHWAFVVHATPTTPQVTTLPPVPV
jgi:hypothetical protein